MKAFEALIGEWHGEGEFPERSTWRIWRAPGEDWNGPDGPGFNQRFIGEISADGNTIEGRWQRGMGDAGDQWEFDFSFTHVLTAV